MARKKKEAKGKGAAKAAPAPAREVVEVFTTPIEAPPEEAPIEVFSTKPVGRIEEIETAIASEVQHYLATTNRPGTDKHYDKYGIYPEDDFILKQNAEDEKNGYPNRFFRKM